MTQFQSAGLAVVVLVFSALSSRGEDDRATAKGIVEKGKNQRGEVQTAELRGRAVRTGGDLNPLKPTHPTAAMGKLDPKGDPKRMAEVIESLTTRKFAAEQPRWSTIRFVVDGTTRVREEHVGESGHVNVQDGPDRISYGPPNKQVTIMAAGKSVEYI